MQGISERHVARLSLGRTYHPDLMGIWETKEAVSQVTSVGEDHFIVRILCIAQVCAIPHQPHTPHHAPHRKEIKIRGANVNIGLHRPSTGPHRSGHGKSNRSIADFPSNGQRVTATAVTILRFLNCSPVAGSVNICK